MVTVEEGIVELSSADSVWRAGAGYQLTYSTTDKRATLANVDPQAVLKWRAGELPYVASSLAAVIADVNRYSRSRIQLVDEDLGSLTFTGTVFTDSIDDWLQAIQDAYPVRAERAANGDIGLYRVPASTAPQPPATPTR